MKMVERDKASVIRKNTDVEQGVVDVDKLFSDPDRLKILLQELVDAVHATNKALAQALIQAADLHPQIVEKLEQETFQALREYLIKPDDFAITVVANDLDSRDEDYDGEDNPMIEYNLIHPDGSQHHLYSHLKNLELDNPFYVDVLNIVRKARFIGKGKENSTDLEYDTWGNLKQLKAMVSEDPHILKKILALSQQQEANRTSSLIGDTKSSKLIEQNKNLDITI